MAGQSPKTRSSFVDVKAIRVITTTIGVILGFSGINHGLFEVLQSNTPTDGLIIQAIGEAQRFWPLGTEEAFTLIPNFLISGILSMIVGLATILWSIWFIPSRHGRTIFLLLFVLLFLVGGGIGQVVFFLPAWAFATRMGKPLTWWRKVLPAGIRPFLSRLWPVTLILSSVIILVGLEIAVFGYIPGLEDPARIQNIGLLLVLTSAILYVLSFIAGFAHELMRMDRDS